MKRAIVTAIPFIALFCVTVGLSRTQEWSSGPAPKRWFSETSPWNNLITQGDVADYSSVAISTYLARKHSINMNWGSAGVYVVYPRGNDSVSRDLRFIGGNGTVWRIPAVPVSPDLIAAATYRLDQRNTDGMTCVVDMHDRRFLSFWQPRPTKDGITIETGGSSPFSGIGWSRIGSQLPSLGRAAGASYCGGLIREVEMRRGVIDHALALAWTKDLIRAPSTPGGGVQYPANFSDGTATTSLGAVPMGARIQLDPTLTKKELLNLGLTKPGDIVIAQALQRFGGYIVDSNTPDMGGSVYFESRFDKGDETYRSTNPWPIKVIARMRFLAPPPRAPLDLAAPEKN